MKTIAAVTVIPAIIIPLVSAPVFGDELEELDKTIAECTFMIKEIQGMPDRRVPDVLLRRCRGLIIFPGIIKAGVVVGVSFGKGIVLRKQEASGQWSKPAFFKIRGGSLGLQAGAQYVDLILLVMSEEGVQGLLEDRLTIGADVSIAAGPIGREASAQTDKGFNAGILSYSRSKGLFVGLSLKGAVLEPDKQANEAYHGKGVSVQDVFYENKGFLSDNARRLIDTLHQVTR